MLGCWAALEVFSVQVSSGHSLQPTDLACDLSLRTKAVGVEAASFHDSLFVAELLVCVSHLLFLVLGCFFDGIAFPNLISLYC